MSNNNLKSRPPFERMELGKGRLPRTGVNALTQAIHPIFGLAWTDGKQVLLAPLQNGEPRLGGCSVLGQFEHVHGLSWGPVFAANWPALLAVQHKKHITVWELCYSSPEKNKLLVSQSCEVREPFPVLPQGCVWHPSKEILTVLTNRDASVICSVRCDSIIVKADIKASGLIHCGCWTEEGDRLVLAVGSALHSYNWDDAQKTLLPCSFCPIFDVGGYICAIEATVGLQIAVATELPLDKICGLNAGIAFDIPADGEMNSFLSQSTLLFVDEELPKAPGRAAQDPEKSASSLSPGTVDLTGMHSDDPRPRPNPLLNLKPKDYLTGSGHDSSHLILVSFEPKATTTRKVNIPGILVPDIMAFDPRAQVVAIASNTCNVILVYSLTPSSMPNIQRIQLAACERPKGICFLRNSLLLILVGKQKSAEPAFLPSSKSDKFSLHLTVKEILLEEEESSTSSGSSPSDSPTAYGLDVAGRRKSPENLPSASFLGGEKLLIPGSDAPFLGRKPLIEEVKSPEREQSQLPRVSQRSKTQISSERPVALETPEVEPVSPGSLKEPNKRAFPKMQFSHTQESPRPPKSNPPRKASRLIKDLERLCESFSELQQRLPQLPDLKQNGKTSAVYPLSQEPSFVHVIYQRPQVVGSVVERRTFLLCDGKLRLSVIQRTFGLSLVEMQHDSLWIILAADSEGFIPLTFTTTQEIIIRDGRVGSETSQDNFARPQQAP
ncbi:WD repeat and coiled-coil-containing protein-like [Tachyglossus aculeatus]|uniref:WD repeat and coiled-coil-containing protein-like n=1 Tax=Tachyglossus aculeatus TaxID=9261 RepID=UPI0018F4AE17|nr:WD repeat and coiled-coil-containing protein-like [Tachyglossus aculeatus]